MPSSNRAWQIPQPGIITRNLKLINADRPTAESLGKSELLIEVAAVGINPHDYKVVEMGGVSKTMVSYPRSPGLDFSGCVLAVGRKVTDVAVGDRVFGRMDPARPGSLAEHIVVPHDGVTVLPEGLFLLHAGGVATAALAACQSIAPYVKAGDRVFLNGGSGGVGTFAIQIAKALSCHVTVSCSTAKVQLCKDLGADEVIDYRATSVMNRLRAAGKVFSLIADYVGGAPVDLFTGCNDLLVTKPVKGHFIYVGGGMNAEAGFGMWAGTVLPSFLGGSKFKWETQVTKNSREDLARIAQWMREGTVRVVVDSVFCFEDVPAAFARLKEGHASGKVIVAVRPEETKR